MTTKYYVTKVFKCLVCDGRGKIQHPAWYEYWAQNAGGLESIDEDRKWFEEHGWIGDVDVRINGIPDEEIYCYECEGQGGIESEVEFDFDALLERVSSLERVVKSICDGIE